MKLRIISFCVAVICMLVGCGPENPHTTVSAGDSFAFNPTTISLPANAATTVMFKNDASGLQHNWVLVNGDDAVAAQVDEAAQSAPNYIPQGPEFVAASQLLNAGQQGSVAIPPLQPGTYTYLCTFPGHYQAGMKGTLTAK